MVSKTAPVSKVLPAATGRGFSEIQFGHTFKRILSFQDKEEDIAPMGASPCVETVL